MVAKQTKPRLCLDGCGEEVGKGATFVPGHDSKLHSRWLAVKRGESKEKLTREQMEYGDSHWVVTERKPRAAAKAPVKAAKAGRRKTDRRSPAAVAAEQAE